MHYLFKIYFNAILLLILSVTGYQVMPCFEVFQLTFLYFRISIMLATCPAHLFVVHLTTIII